MSNGRKGDAAGQPYRDGYLRSRTWFARRSRWFSETGGNQCVVCLKVEADPSATLELHHVTYDGVEERDGRWLANEHDDDLMPMHPLCHEQVHRAIERDQGLRHLVSRQEATRRAIRVVRRRLEAILIDDDKDDA